MGKNQFSQELPVPQPASRFIGNSYQFGPDMDLACARTLTDNSAASSVIQFGGFSTPQSIPEDGCHLLCDSVGSTLDAVPPILAQNPEPWSGHAVLWQCVSRRMEDPPPNGSDDLGDLREGRGQPLCLRIQLSLPNILLKGARRPGPRLAQPLPVCLPSDCSVPSGHHIS